MKNTRARSRDFGKGDWKSYFRLIPYIRLPWLLIAVAFVVDLVYSDVMAYVPVSTSALFGGEFTGRALASAVLYNVLNFGLMFASLILPAWSPPSPSGGPRRSCGAGCCGWIWPTTTPTTQPT